MEGCIRPFGGEFWYEDSIIDNKAVNLVDCKILLNGGQSAIKYIIQDIDLGNRDYILMPSYLCPTILYNFIKKNINILFYEVNDDLSINIDSIKQLVNIFNVKALFFINYFGFYHNNDTISYLKNLKKAGMILIEDAVQMLWFKRLDKFIGDYVFNSFRKFLPADGSIVLCNKSETFDELNDRYRHLINEARNTKTKFIHSKLGNEEDFLTKFSEAEELYYKRTTVNMIDKESKEFLNNINYQLIKDKRIRNYQYLFDRLKDYKKVKVLFDKNLIEDNIPLALPIYIDQRDIIREKLREYNIFCPVHWNITEEAWAVDFPISIQISKSILSIPIDWRYDKSDINYFLDKFTTVFNE